MELLKRKMAISPGEKRKLTTLRIAGGIGDSSNRMHHAQILLHMKQLWYS